MNASLEGLLVVSLEQAVAAPMCTMRLADAGARVIKVERAEGDFAREYDHAVNGESAYFVWLNRGKESIALDVKNANDAALLHRMIGRADVFAQNLAAGAAERAGFGSGLLRERNPRLITCDISGYGDSGPYRDMKAYDLLVQCETGLASITGSPAHAGRVGVSIADIACGSNAHAAILQALYERQRTGRGSAIAVSLFDSLAEWMTVPLLQFEYSGHAPERVGLHHPSIAPYGAYRCADGEVVLAVQNEREWRTFCEGVLEQPSLVADARFSSNVGRVANRAALDGAIGAVLNSLTREQAVQRLRDSRVAYGSVNSVEDLSMHVALRRMETGTPAGLVSTIAAAIRVNGTETLARAVPALNEHGDALRKEFAA
ncbi:MAG: CaiB/BaiF CoA-transferase family protein [Gemmatimonas sp.]